MFFHVLPKVSVPCLSDFSFRLTLFPLIFSGVIVNLLLKHFQKPTPIQSITWPVALSGHDLVVLCYSSFVSIFFRSQLLKRVLAKLWVSFCQLLFMSRTSLNEKCVRDL